MNSLKNKSILFSVTLLLSSSLFAHEGHGNFEHSVLHYFYSLQHLAVIILGIVAVILLVKLYKRVKV